jgi:hypothetical protein
MHVRMRGVLGHLFLPSKQAGGDAAQSQIRQSTSIFKL